jgi:glycosyltransferase involved in cell wall biosynthesis
LALLGGRKKLYISVIIPVGDGIGTLGQCLASLKQSNFPGFEVIVVDDCSKEDCSEVVRSYGFKAIRLNEPSGSWYARNKGAKLAMGDILVFIDCDMVIQPDALHRIHNHFSENHYAAISGICGSQTNTNRLTTRYKNLWMYYSYTNSPENFDWFISGIGAVKGEVFFGLKGFDTTFHIKTGGGDLEFGRRLKESGQKIFLDKKLQGKHLKPYTLWGLLRNDYNRSKGWFQLVVGKKMVWHVIKKLRIANIYPAFIISVFTSLFFLFSLFLSPLFKIFLILTVFSALAYLIINYPLFRFLRREGGFGFLLKAIPLSLLDHLVSGFGVIAGCIGCLSSLVTKRFLKPKLQAKSRKDLLQDSGRKNL